MKQEEGKKYGDSESQSLAVLKQTSDNSIVAIGKLQRSISEDRWVRIVVPLCLIYYFTWCGSRGFVRRTFRLILFWSRCKYITLAIIY